MRVIQWYTYSNIHIALCATSLCSYCHLLLYGESPSSSISLFVFSSTLFAYNFHRRLGGIYSRNKVKDKILELSNNAKDQWLTQHQSSINWIIICSFVMALGLLYFLPKRLLILIFPLATLSLLYILQIRRLPSLRSIPFLKIFIIAFVWGGTMVLLPVLANSSSDLLFNWEAQALTFCVGLFVFGETIPFDIRDLEEDERTKLKTIPLKLGPKKSKLLSLSAYSISSALFIGLCIQHNKPAVFVVSFLLSLFFSFLLITQVGPKKKEIYYSFWIECSLAFPFILYQFLCFLPYFAI